MNQNFQNTNMNLLNSAQIRGFFEGDGGIQVRIDKTVNGFTFRPLFKFGQKTENVQIIKWIQSSLGTKRIITDDSLTNSSSLVLPFKGEINDAGPKLKQMYLENKPVNPGTLKDLLIALVILDYEMQKVMPLSTKSAEILRKKPEKERKRIELLSLLWLRFQRSATRNIRTAHSIEYYQNHLRATPSEINEADRFGNELLKPITKEVDQLVSDLNNDKIQIDDGFLAYYHVADGSLSFDFEKRKLAGGKVKIKIEPRWTITDDMTAKPLLERIVRQYNFSDYQGIRAQNSGYARARGWQKATEVVIPFFKNRILPDVERTKTQTFVQVCELHYNSETFKDPVLYESYIRLAYFLNESTSDKRTQAKLDNDYKLLMETIMNEIRKGRETN